MWGTDPTATTGREWLAYPGLSLTHCGFIARGRKPLEERARRAENGTSARQGRSCPHAPAGRTELGRRSAILPGAFAPWLLTHAPPGRTRTRSRCNSLDL